MRWLTHLPAPRALRIAHAAIVCAVLLVCGVSVSELFSAETPHGELHGTLMATDMQNPLPHIRITLVNQDQSQRDSTTRSTTTDGDGHFVFDHLAAGTYTVVTSTRAHRQPEEPVSIQDGQVRVVTIALKPTDPFLHIFVNQHVYTTQEKPLLRCHGFSPAGTLAVTIYTIQPAAAVHAWQGFLPQSFTLKGKPLQTVDLSTVPELTRYTTLRWPIKARDAEGAFRENIPLGSLAPGVYLASAEIGAVRALSAITVTDLGVVVKAVSSKVLAYAVNMTTDAPVPGAAIEVRENEKIVCQGVTGADGLLLLPLPALPAPAASATNREDGDDDADNQEVQVVGRAGANMAVAAVDISAADNDNLRIYTYTDRPVYRPGQSVDFKSVLRELHGDDYHVPSARAVSVQVTDEEDQIYSGKLTSNDYGSVAGAFTLNENALPGTYTITVQSGAQSADATFAVAEYRKPEFSVQVTPATKRVAVGDKITVTVSASYYFGAPVGNAHVSYQVTREPDWGAMDTDSWDADLPNTDNDGDMDDGGGEVVTTGEGVTDASGQLALTIPATPIKEKNVAAYDGMDWRYTVHASVEDVSERSEEGSGNVLMTQGDFALDATSENYLTQPGAPDGVTVHAQDYDGNPLSGIAGQAEVASVSWAGGQETLHDESVVPWKTDRFGEAQLTVTPKQQGDYRVILHANDSHGHTISERCWLWVMRDDNGDFDYPYQDLDVRVAKRLYHAGETAEIVINTRYAPQQALLTYEGGDLLEQRPILLKNKSTVIEVPVRANFMPNIHVGVCLVHGKKFFSGEAIVNVSRARKALHVTITPDLPQYEPGQQATFTVKTTTTEGLPAQSEVSFGLVDEAIYAIREDDTENITSFFYPRREDSAATSFSFPDIYLSGDEKAGATVRTRRFFPDTACWQPCVVTNRAGIARVTLTMPDSLTTWRATCRAATLDTRVGQGTGSTVVSKPFLVRLETPRFLTQGDTATIAVIAHNLTDQALSVKLGLEATGAELQQNAGIGTYLIPAGGSQRVTWTVQAADIGTATFRAWGTTGPVSGAPLSDAMALSLPVAAKGRQRVDARAGSVAEQETLTFPHAGNIIPGTSRLTIRLQPSYASAMLGSLQYLAQYPYGCTEQTMSCFLPDVVVMQLLKQTGAPDAELQQQVPQMVQAGLFKLYGFQHGDGGWGWWTYDASDPWMTAYVIFGLTRAREAGFTVTQDVLDNGLSALQQMAKQSGKDVSPSGRAFMAYVLASNGCADPARQVLAEFQGKEHAQDFAQAGPWGQAMLALAAQQLGQTAEARRLLDPLWLDFDAGKLQGGSQLGYERDFTEYYSETDDVAALLFAASYVTPRDPRQEGLVRWLMLRREDDHWESTRDTAFALYGLARYLRQSNELHPDLDAQVTLNGQPVLTRHIGAADVDQPAITITLEKENLPTGPLTVVLTRHGQGMLYYSATLEQTVSDDISAPAAGTPDLSITRCYRPLSKDPAAADSYNFIRPSQDYQVGDTVEVVLLIHANRSYEHVMIEDPLPAGCEAFDRGEIEEYDWNYWWTNQIVRDNMVCFAVNSLQAGEARTIDYNITAQTPGVFTALPVRIYDMYNPNAWADGGAQQVRVHEKM